MPTFYLFITKTLVFVSVYGFVCTFLICQNLLSNICFGGDWGGDKYDYKELENPTNPSWFVYCNASWLLGILSL